jgi:hypothetical protein
MRESGFELFSGKALKEKSGAIRRSGVHRRTQING